MLVQKYRVDIYPSSSKRSFSIYSSPFKISTTKKKKEKKKKEEV